MQLSVWVESIVLGKEDDCEGNRRHARCKCGRGDLISAGETKSEARICWMVCDGAHTERERNCKEQ